MDLPIGKPINQLVWWDGTVVCLVVQSESRPPFFHTIYSARWIKMVRACTLSTVHNSIRVHRWLEYDGYRRMLGLWNRDELRFNLLDFWRIRYRFSLWCPMVNHAYSFLASVEQDEPTWKSNNAHCLQVLDCPAAKFDKQFKCMTWTPNKHEWSWVYSARFTPKPAKPCEKWKWVIEHKSKT